MHTIKLTADFDPCPSGRYRHESDTSGEAFRDDVLKPAIQEYGSVIVDLNDADSLPPSFLDESIGMLARDYGSEFANKVAIVLTDDDTALRKLNESIATRSKECTA